jgi:hypothetical protein
MPAARTVDVQTFLNEHSFSRFQWMIFAPPKSRPFENASPAPIAATIALEIIGPMPGTDISRSQPLS